MRIRATVAALNKNQTMTNALNAMATPALVSRKRCFDPVVDRQTRLLVLGSLPGDQSLVRNEYYGNRQNKFWELIGAVIDVDLRSLPYEVRLGTLLAHGIGVWDVIAEAERKGSLDANIRNESHNALEELVATLPVLRAVAFNGGTAARIGGKRLRSLAGKLILIDLPSSSPANTQAFGIKLQVWKTLVNFK
jgi:TDG/mug DNA glycosylase family protein